MASSATSRTRTDAPPSVTHPVESPWFWLAIFSVAGLVVLLGIAPKYDQRQPQLERQFYARQAAGQTIQGADGPIAPPTDGTHLVPLEPLNWILAAAAIGFGAVTVRQWWKYRCAGLGEEPRG